MFSSYPGYLESLDDFYVMNSGLAMLQTTNGIPNALSKTGQEWYSNVANQNSGTYNNQYMVINYAMSKKNEPLPNDFLWVIEQIPGYVEGADMTQILERGYWASYNVPAFEKVFNMSGYPALVAAHGVENSYDLAPRARIFRRDANGVSNLEEYKALLRYNDYKT